MFEYNLLLSYSLTLLGLVTGPWILWYLYAKLATWVTSRRYVGGLVKIRGGLYVITGYNPETRVATIKDWPPKD